IEDLSLSGIPPGGTFDYVVPINESGQWGTYWVHAHASGHYVDGLRAPLLLHRPNETYASAYDEEFTVVLGDWYHTEHSELLKDFINIKNPGGAEPVPDSGLVYFAQNASHLPPIAGKSPSATTSSVGFNENATLPFQPGKTYRLRVVNTSAFAMFYFWIEPRFWRRETVRPSVSDHSTLWAVSPPSLAATAVVLTGGMLTGSV
ncbi:ferroxidase fet3, partial [Marasmius sp. AFHP31]